MNKCKLKKQHHFDSFFFWVPMHQINPSMKLMERNLTALLFLLAVLVSPATVSKAQDQYMFPSLVNKNIFSFSRTYFTLPDYQYLNIAGDASIINNDQAIQLTPPHSINDNFSLFHKSGRATFRRSFKLYERTSYTTSFQRILSFNSTFLMNVALPTRIGRGERIPGEGLAFVIASDLETPTGSSDGFHGLTNQTHAGNYSSNKFIAIEFDTVINDENGDPNNNHMGLNINSVRSIKTVNLSEHNISTIAQPVKDTTIYKVWIQYNGKTKVIDVYMGLNEKPKPDNPFLSEKVDLRKHLNEYSYFGFSASSTGNDTTQLNYSILGWDLTVKILREDKSIKWWINLILIGVPAVVVLVICVVGFGYCLHMWRVKDDLDILVALRSLPGVPKEYSFKELKKATNNFDEKLKLGQGGFGVVYKGVFPNANSEYKEVAVKKFLRENLKSKFDFLAELSIINRLRHKHLVRLAGWCHKNGVLLLVYEFMPNGSLDYHLYGGSDTILGWNHRYKVTSGVASALEYLHNGYEQIVVHRDLKASNIMLDSDYNARLGDFGLARVIEHERNSFGELEGFPGTIGYIAPECFHTGKSTKESDVFGFGAVVLELICGKRPWTSFEGFGSLVDWVWKLHGEERILEAIDARLGDVYVVEEARRLLLLGLACSHPIASERPKTETIFQIISGSVPVPSISPQKPQFVWPSIGISSTSIDESKIMTNNEEDEMPMLSAYYTARHSVLVPTATTTSAATTMKDVSLDESHHSLQVPTMQLRMQLHSTKKGSMNASDYLLKMQSLADRLAAVGRPISEDDLVIRILCGLGPQYSAFVMAMITGHESFKFADVQKFLLDQEVQLAMGSLHVSSEYNNETHNHQNKFQLWHWFFQ